MKKFVSLIKSMIVWLSTPWKSSCKESQQSHICCLGWTNPAWIKAHVHLPAISNLTTVSKIIERLVINRLRLHLPTSLCFACLQSAYQCTRQRQHCYMSWIVCTQPLATRKPPYWSAWTSQQSAAFDIIKLAALVPHRDGSPIGHSVWSLVSTHWPLLSCCPVLVPAERSTTQHWKSEAVILGTAPQHWSVAIVWAVKDAGSRCISGISQGSVLRPLLFTAYVLLVGDLIESFDISCHQFADDTVAGCHECQRCHTSPQEARQLLGCCLVLVPVEQSKTQCWQVKGHHPWHSTSALISRHYPSSRGHQKQAAGSTQAELLGVTIDSRLQFDCHTK